MAIHTVIGNASRGATWISLHNGGGTGWGEAINCGFGLVLCGDDDSEDRAEEVLFWDVHNGIARRSWSGNQNAKETIILSMEHNALLKVTVPTQVNEKILEKLK